MKARQPSLNTRQRGLAALEFALVFPVMFLVLYGLMTFAAAFYTQLVISRAVEDGARAVPFLQTFGNTAGDREALIQTEIVKSLASSPIRYPGSSGALIARQESLRTLLGADGIRVEEAPCVTTIGAGTCVIVILEFPYGDDDDTRLLPSITLPSIGNTESWMPDTLTSRATVRIDT